MKKRALFFCFAVLIVLTVATPISAMDSETNGNNMPGQTTRSSNILPALPETFIFSSGAGGWATTMDILNDGSFRGQYRDSNVDEVYICNFSGKFTNIKQVNPFTYSMKLTSLNYDREIGKVIIGEQGIRYIISEPYGLETGTDFLLYLPGIATANLPEVFLSWVIDGTTPKTLPFHGLYNITGEYGFYGDGTVAKRLFTDVSANSWYAPYIYDLVEKKILSGKGEGKFDPEGNVTRAEFAKILAFASGDDLNTYNGKTSFGDVAIGQWFSNSVEWAFQNKVVYGKENGYAPDDNITRQEMAVMINRYANYKKVTLPKKAAAITFNDDANIDKWAKDSVSIMQQAGIINGKGNGIFDPKGNATRAEASTMISIFLKL